MSPNKYAVEAIGAFFLVLTIGMTVIDPGAGALAPLAIGSALMVMIFAGGHISGGHFNPAVTLAVWLRGKLPTSDVAPYIVAQIVGGLLAALVVGFLKPAMPSSPLVPDAAKALVAELLFTFALCWVVLNSATAKGTANNSFYGLAIGFTVLTGAFAVGGISGGAFNPAVAIGAAAMGLVSWSSIWIHLVAEVLGAVLAAGAFRVFSPADQATAAERRLAEAA